MVYGGWCTTPITLARHVYAELARAYGLRLCSECSASANAHRRGSVDGTTIHWTDRHHHRKGLYRFLKLVHMATQEEPNTPLWVRIYERNLFAQEAGLRLGYRLGGQLADLDRAYVAYLMHHDDSAIVSPKLVQRVRRWTLR